MIKYKSLVILFFLLTSISLFAQESGGTKEDLLAIEKLHKMDEEATKKNDFKTLRSLIDDDAVIMPDGQNIVRGKDEIDQSFEDMKSAMADYEVLQYKLKVEELKVLGNYAYEWGTIYGTSRKKGSKDTFDTSYKFMRILKKEPNGDWKIYRSMWNSNQ
jgi:ketosteroid isomerase-like protein